MNKVNKLDHRGPEVASSAKLLADAIVLDQMVHVEFLGPAAIRLFGLANQVEFENTSVIAANILVL